VNLLLCSAIFINDNDAKNCYFVFVIHSISFSLMKMIALRNENEIKTKVFDEKRIGAKINSERKHVNICPVFIYLLH